MSRGRTHRLARAAIWLAAIAWAALGVATPASAAAGTPAGGGPSYSLSVSSRLIGTAKPYDFDLGASNGGTFMSMQRSATTGNHPTQQHLYILEDSTLSCEGDLSSCDLSDNDALGPDGRIDLTFTPNGATQTTKSRCDDGTVYRVDKTRPGTLSGIFRIRTHTGYFGVIQNKGTGVHVLAQLPAQAEKSIDKDVDCQSPVAATIAGSSQCNSSLGVSASPDDNAVSQEFVAASRYSGSPEAFLELGYLDPNSTDRLTIAHLVGASVPKKSVRETSSDPDPLEEVKINFDAAKPFASGFGRFDPTDPPEFEGDDCNTIHRDGNLNGAFEAKFDGWGLHEFSSLVAQAGKSSAN